MLRKDRPSFKNYYRVTVSCPFITEMHFAFQTPSKLYLVLDYYAGGEFRSSSGDLTRSAAVTPS